MVDPFVGGIALDVVFGELLKAVVEIKGKAVMFKQTLAYLRSTLVAIDPVVKEIAQYNKDLSHRKEELELLIRVMEEGKKLVLKCLKINRLNYVARAKYRKQLLALVGSLENFIRIDMQTQMARDQKETLLISRRILSVLNKSPLVNRGDTKDPPSEYEDVMETGDTVEKIMDDIDQIPRSSCSDTSYSVPLDGSESESENFKSAATNSEEQVMEPNTGITQEAGQNNLMSGKSSDQLRTAQKRFLGINLLGGFTRQVEKAVDESPPSKATPEPSPVYCTECGTFIKQNDKLYSKGAEKTGYSYCNLCCNEQVPPGRPVFSDSSYSFGPRDFLRASRKVLGKGSYGTTYKYTLKDGSVTFAAKRLRGVTVGQKEFQDCAKLASSAPKCLSP